MPIRFVCHRMGFFSFPRNSEGDTQGAKHLACQPCLYVSVWINIGYGLFSYNGSIQVFCTYSIGLENHLSSLVVCGNFSRNLCSSCWMEILCFVQIKQIWILNPKHLDFLGFMLALCTCNMVWLLKES